MPETIRIASAYDRHQPVILRHSTQLDNLRDYVISDGPDPETMASLLREVDAGEIDKLVLLQQEMEAKDARLRGLAETRRGAVTALDWEIEPESDTQYPLLASLMAKYCRDRLRSLDTFPDTLEHLQTATGPNVAATELVWARGELVETQDVPAHRLAGDRDNPSGVAIRTDDDIMGTPVVEFAPEKFIVYHPHRHAGFPFRSTLTHSTVWPFMAKWFSRIDWLSFSEVFGQPIPYATFDPEVPSDVRDKVAEMLQHMGSDVRAAFPKGTTLAYLQASGTGETYQRQMDWANDEYAIAWLGQTLTTDVGNRGSFAAAKVHDNVRADILMADLKREARCIRDQLLRPMCALRFPFASRLNMPVPYWRRLLNERTDIEAARLGLDRLGKAKELGLKVERDEQYETLAFTPVKEDDNDAMQDEPETA